MTATSRVELWKALTVHHAEIAPMHLRDLFAADPDRPARLSLSACDLTLDASRHRIDGKAFDLLVRLAVESGLEARRDALFEGRLVNETEGRPALHAALRNRSGRPVLVDGRDVMEDVNAVLEKMRGFSEAVRGGTWTGFTGKHIRDVVNVGIGGSDLGPAMAAAALDGWQRPSPRLHYVSNVDVLHVETVLRDLDPETTLFIVASKTFSTQETLLNATTARRWLLDALSDEAAIGKHFVGVSARPDRAAAFGIDPENVFGMQDGVGGRTSLWSAVGLSLAVGLGMDAFDELLAGAHAMDEHFRAAPADANLPVWMGMLTVWYADFFGAATHAVLPYDYALRLLPAHLQQLSMESNGKRVTMSGAPIEVSTAPVVWGGPGSNGQHAYYQLLHQGTQMVPADLIVAAVSQAGTVDHQDAVLAHALAQGEALMNGRTADEARVQLEAQGLPAADVERLVPHMVMPGNRPSSTILYRRLTPRILGALVALYEHKTFVESVVWGNNPFDQYGVELGKQLAGRVQEALENNADPDSRDATTKALLERLRDLRSHG